MNLTPNVHTDACELAADAEGAAGSGDPVCLGLGCGPHHAHLGHMLLLLSLLLPQVRGSAVP